MGARQNCSMSVLVLLAVYVLSRIILEPGSNASEVLRITDNHLRVHSAVEREMAELDRQAEDYASWDDLNHLQGEERSSAPQWTLTA